MGIFVSNFGLHYNNFQKLFLTKVKFHYIQKSEYIKFKLKQLETRKKLRACYSLKYWVFSFQKKKKEKK